jgi:hypothetical protein
VVDLNVYILWDAEQQDARGGFPFSKGIQAPPDAVWEALARGMSSGTRQLRSGVTETIIIARPEFLARALVDRVNASNGDLVREAI